MREIDQFHEIATDPSGFSIEESLESWGRTWNCLLGWRSSALHCGLEDCAYWHKRAHRHYPRSQPVAALLWGGQPLR